METIYTVDTASTPSAETKKADTLKSLLVIVGYAAVAATVVAVKKGQEVTRLRSRLTHTEEELHSTSRALSDAQNMLERFSSVIEGQNKERDRKANRTPREAVLETHRELENLDNTLRSHIRAAQVEREKQQREDELFERLLSKEPKGVKKPYSVDSQDA